MAGGVADDSEGYYIQPTIVQSADPRDRIMNEEIFGPVVSVYVYPDAQAHEVNLLSLSLFLLSLHLLLSFSSTFTLIPTHQQVKQAE